jgi:hypothetical protein
MPSNDSLFLMLSWLTIRDDTSYEVLSRIVELRKGQITLIRFSTKLCKNDLYDLGNDKIPHYCFASI